MKILAFPFEARGFHYELIERQGLVCLVKQTRIGHGHWCYELVKPRVYPDKFAFGKLIPAHEAYPGDEDWGVQYLRSAKLYPSPSKWQRLGNVVA